MTTFNDIFKSSFLESAAEFSALDIVLAMVFAFAIGLFIFLVYKKTYKGVMYSTGFSITLIALPMITALVILAVTSNVILSLGMVGALSIVRFRSAIKEPMEIVYLFWAIAAGIVVGAGLIVLAVIGSVIIGVVLLVIANRKTNDSPYILVLSMEDDKCEDAAAKIIKSSVSKYMVRSKTVKKDGVELTVEVKIKDELAGFTSKLMEVDGVNSAVLVSYNGEYIS